MQFKLRTVSSRTGLRSAPDALGATYRIDLAYHGAEFHGWQYQEEARTVEGELRRALAPLFGTIRTVGASRTDKGVHALGQVVRVECDRERGESELHKALEARTPRDIQVMRVRRVPAEFHPHQAVEKRYLYSIDNGAQTNLFSGPVSWAVRTPLAVDAMQAAAQSLIGRHDFASFQNQSKDPPDSSVKEVREVCVQRFQSSVQVQVIGDGFLYRMVRNIVGTLVEVGRGALPADAVAGILAACDRRRAGPSAPPQGLFLMEIRYPGEPPLALSGQRFDGFYL